MPLLMLVCNILNYLSLVTMSGCLGNISLYALFSESIIVWSMSFLPAHYD